MRFEFQATRASAHLTRGLCLALAIGGFASTANAGQNDGPSKQKEQASDTTVGKNSVRLISAESLIGRDVRDREGNTIGQVEHILIRSGSGEVRFALMDPDGFSAGGRLIALPWQVLRPSAMSQTIELEATREQLADAPRIHEEKLSELLEPVVITRVARYWLPMTPAAPNPADSPGSQAPGSDGVKNEPESTTRSQASSGSAVRQDQQRDSMSARSGEQEAEQSPAEPAQGTNTQGRQARDEAHLLLGRSFVTTLHPPTLQIPQRIVGRTVESERNEELGEIERVVIDPNAAKVAYVLLSRGGFLGLGDERVPVPLQQLEWKDRDSFEYDGSTALLDEFSRLDGKDEDFPRVVNRSDVAALYRHFGETPYWSQNQQSAADRRSASAKGVSPDRD